MIDCILDGNLAPDADVLIPVNGVSDFVLSGETPTTFIIIIGDVRATDIAGALRCYRFHVNHSTTVIGKLALFDDYFLADSRSRRSSSAIHASLLGSRLLTKLGT